MSFSRDVVSLAVGHESDNANGSTSDRCVHFDATGAMSVRGSGVLEASFVNARSSQVSRNRENHFVDERFVTTNTE